jgi:hypothetical protein
MPSKILIFWATCGGKAAAGGLRKRFSGAAGYPLGAVPQTPRWEAIPPLISPHWGGVEVLKVPPRLPKR